MSRRLSDPSWKSGPTHPEPSASEHAIAPEDFDHAPADWDGFGQSEVEKVEGTPLVVLQEVATCARDGCDATHKRRLLFTTHTLTEEEERALRDSAFDVSDSALAEYVSEEGERVDVETIEVDGIGISAEHVVEDEPRGECYGRVEPDYEAQWRDI